MAWFDRRGNTGFPFKFWMQPSYGRWNGENKVSGRHEIKWCNHQLIYSPLLPSDNAIQVDQYQNATEEVGEWCGKVWAPVPTTLWHGDRHIRMGLLFVAVVVCCMRTCGTNDRLALSTNKNTDVQIRSSQGPSALPRSRESLRLYKVRWIRYSLYHNCRIMFIKICLIV